MLLRLIRAAIVVACSLLLPIAAALAIAAFVQTASMPARADAAAGSAAFEKGDYVRAMAEWASAAQRDDPDAEFGLGMLYERGDGDLRQDYKQAAQWYVKAAAQGNVGAEYRLALIYSAGGDDFSADLVAAYKWILLASGQGLASDVKGQLAAVLDPNQRAEAENSAAIWRRAHVGRPTLPEVGPPSVAAAPPTASGAGPSAIPPAAGVAPVATARSGGCPGWPFPTLPCTEQFPALGGAAQHPAKPRAGD